MITYLKHPKLSHPQMLVAWPGMGYVAFKTVSYLVDFLSAERFAFIQPGDYFSPSGVMVEESLASVPPLPESNFYCWKHPDSGDDLVLFLGDAQPPAELQIKMAQEVIQMAKSMGVFRVFTFAAAPAGIQHKDNPRVWGVANARPLRNFLPAQGVKLLRAGHISGLNGLLLGVASREGLPGTCLLGEIPYYTVNMENPRASLAILKVLEKILGLELDFSPLSEDVKRFDREITQMGKKAQETMETFMHAEEGFHDADEFPEAEGTAGEEAEPEEESPTLPDSARRKIEELFRRVKLDPTQAPLLKSELDKWGVYSQYEDRFLDLFRGKKKPKDN